MVTPAPLAQRVLNQYKRHERQIADAYVEVYRILHTSQLNNIILVAYVNADQTVIIM